MKELIGTAFLIAGLFGAGTIAAKKIHSVVRKEALNKVSQGMPSLTGLTKALRAPRRH